MILQDVFHPEQMGEQFSPEQMNSMDAQAKTDNSLPMAFKAEPGFFDGMGTGAWKGLVYGAEKTGSSLLGAASSTIASPLNVQYAAEEANDVLAANGASARIGDTAAFGRQQSESFDRKAKELRDDSKHYEVDAATMGTAAQILHGLASTIPQAIGYGMVAGPAGGSVLFGADMGIRTAQELKDKGVDERTATNAGMASFVSNALGMRIPAAFGPNRIVSALAGGAVNVGTTGAEQGAIQYILANQNYKKLSEQYQLTLPGAATSAFFGAAMGALFFHTKPAAARRAEEKVTAAQVEDTLYARLMATDTYKGKETEARATAAAQARSAINLAKASGQNVMDILPKITFDKDGKASAPEGALQMPKTGPYPWKYGDHVSATPNRAVDTTVVNSNSIRPLLASDGRIVTSIKNISHALSSYVTIYSNKSVKVPPRVKLINSGDTGWELTIGASDRSEIANNIATSAEENPAIGKALEAAVQNLPEIVRKAFLAESYWDNKKAQGIKDERGIQAIHRLYSAAIVDGKLYAIKLTVKDRVSDSSKETEKKNPRENRLSLYSLSGIEAEEIKKPLGDYGGAFTKKRILRPTPKGKVIIKQLLSGVYRDGDAVYTGNTKEFKSKFFEPYDEKLDTEGGSYYNDPNDPYLKEALRREAENRRLWQPARGFYVPGDNSIHLTPDANLATFSHEWGHWYLTNLFQFAKDGRITAEMQEDVGTLLRSFGIKSLEDWDALGFEGQERFQEQFARQLEQYLATGKAPSPGLRYIFETIADTIREAYRGFRGDAPSAIAAEYKAQTGADLPPMSKEVKEVFDRMYRDSDADAVTPDQVAAARTVQASRVGEEKRNKLRETSDSKPIDVEERAQRAAARAEAKAVNDILDGRPVDVSSEIGDMDISDRKVDTLNADFARTYMDADTGTVVVLQNRDRTRVASRIQMNSIAAHPQYGLLSFSRGTSGGAPIVSFGKLPPKAQLGRHDVVTDTTGARTPIVYAVVEADDVLTSNGIDGSVNKGYGDPARMNAVAGNGRATGITEAYRRGTADKYRADLEADSIHGVSPEVIRGMKHPMLVRIMSPSDVTTGFISRSNQDVTLARSDVEIAREDAPKIRARIGEYQFDENGKPTKNTVNDFIADLHEPNALGTLLNARGEPTPEAVRRIQQAVFYEAYRDPVLASLFSEDLDPGIVRVLNALVSVAPQIIKLREASDGKLDLARPIVEAVNMLYTAMKAAKGKSGTSSKASDAVVANQNPLLDSLAAQPFLQFFKDNANSAAAIRRLLEPTIAWARATLDSSDTSGLFGEAGAWTRDLADVVHEMRSIENNMRQAAGLEPLPEVDTAAVRADLEARAKAAEEAAKAEEAKAPKTQEREAGANPADELDDRDLADAEEAARVEQEQQEAEADAQAAAEAEQADLASRREEAKAIFDEQKIDSTRVAQVMQDFPDMQVTIMDANGQEIKVDVAEAMRRADAEIEQADVDAAALGKAAACMLNNRGI